MQKEGVQKAASDTQSEAQDLFGSVDSSPREQDSDEDGQNTAGLEQVLFDTSGNTMHLDAKHTCAFMPFEEDLRDGAQGVEISPEAKQLIDAFVARMTGDYRERRKINDDDILSFVREVGGAAATLEDCNLDGSNVTDAGIEALAKSCTSLKNINLDSCSKVTDNGVIALADNSSRSQR